MDCTQAPGESPCSTQLRMKKGITCYDSSCLMLLAMLVIALLAPSASASRYCDEAAGNYGGVCDDEEPALESDAVQRVLVGLKVQRYITYPVLGRQACDNGPGMPYTQGRGCLSRAVNPPGIGCFAIYHCRSR